MGVSANETVVYLDRPGIRGDDSFPAAVAFRVDQALLSEVRNGTREVTLAVAKLRGELRDRVATFDSSEYLEFDLSQHVVT